MPALAMISRLRHFAAGSPPLPAESSSCSCGPPIRLRLLPTPPHSDAVSFGYGVLAFPDKDFHPDVQTPPRAYYEARCARRPGGCAPRRAAEVAPTGHRLPRRSVSGGRCLGARTSSRSRPRCSRACRVAAPGRPELFAHATSSRVPTPVVTPTSLAHYNIICAIGGRPGAAARRASLG